MIRKIMTADQAVADINDGASIMVGGFLGTGTPEILMEALVRKGVKHLTVICNDGGLPAKDGSPARGVGKLLEQGMIDHLIASHVGMNPLVGQGMNEGTLKCTLVPQGTLAERIRAAAAGLGGVLTPTGVGTIIAEGKETMTINGKAYLLEMPLAADFALCRASECDDFGNFHCNLATKNFNGIMAMAAETVIVGSEKIIRIGETHPDNFEVPGIFVDRIVGGEQPWLI
ncbi:MAG: CoA transferase subunit A [Firmicutes bacterium]|nr:CoA transferase subunit A [Bacillota bacterium]NBI62224.1 CoA transferase subunit A [Clostridiales bacterium]